MFGSCITCRGGAGGDWGRFTVAYAATASPLVIRFDGDREDTSFGAAAVDGAGNLHLGGRIDTGHGIRFTVVKLSTERQ